MSLMFPNVELVAWLANIAQHNVGNLLPDLIKQTSPRRLSTWLRSLVSTDTAGSQRYPTEKAGGSVLDVSTGYGGAWGLRCLSNSLNAGGSGSMMDPAPA